MANEKRLIDVDALIKKWISERDFLLNRWGGYGALLNREKGRVDELNACIGDAENAPTVDAEEVVHGRWIEKKLDDFRMWELRCSECGWIGISNYDAYDEPFDFNYCPNCGANMIAGDGNG